MMTDTEFEEALEAYREAALEAAQARFDADMEENTILLSSQGKNAEQRKAEAELGSRDARLSAVLAAIPAKATELRVLYLINKAKSQVTGWGDV